MLRRSRVLLPLAALVLASTLLPVVAADHAYSHRYIIWGRVVDADNNPVPGVEVGLEYERLATEGYCRGEDTGSNLTTDAFGATEHSPVTNPYGEFIICFHTHRINRVEPGSGVLHFRDATTSGELNKTVDVAFNPYFRSQFVLVQLDEVHPRANPAPLEGNYTVFGRLWYPDRGTVESIRVEGNTLHGEPVEIEILDGAGAVVATGATRTNDYGDFSTRIPVPGRLEEGTVVMRAQGKEFRQPVHPAGISYFEAEVEDPSNALATFLMIGGGVLGVAAVGGGGWYVIKRMGERRDAQLARAKSTRKRARK